MYNEVIIIKKSETNSKRGPFFMFLGQELRNRRQIPIEDLFFRDHQTFAMEINYTWTRFPDFRP